MMYDEMLTLICQSIEIYVLSTEYAKWSFLISFLDWNSMWDSIRKKLWETTKIQATQLVYTLEKSLPSSWWHGIFFEFARLKLVLLKGHIRREMFSEKILKFDAGNKKLQWFMPPSLSKCWARCNIFISYM